MSDEKNEIASADAPAEPNTGVPTTDTAADTKLFFKVIFLDSKAGQIEIETNIRDPRQALVELLPVIEHLRRQGMLAELVAAQTQAQRQGIIRPAGINGGGASGRKIF